MILILLTHILGSSPLSLPLALGAPAPTSESAPEISWQRSTVVPRRDWRHGTSGGRWVTVPPSCSPRNPQTQPTEPRLFQVPPQVSPQLPQEFIVEGMRSPTPREPRHAIARRSSTSKEMPGGSSSDSSKTSAHVCLGATNHPWTEVGHHKCVKEPTNTNWVVYSH